MADEDDLDGRLRQAGRYVAGTTEDDGMLERITARLLGTPGGTHEIGRFRIERSLGRGGMGAVFEAWDPELERRVALKLLRRDVGTYARRRTIIEAEARALARLADRHVVQVYETGTHEGALFVVMELVDGPSLEVWQAEPRTPAELLDKYVQAGRGLAAAHRAGLVHRDFKPANVLLRPDGEVRVADFGLARAIDAERSEEETESDDGSAPSDRSRGGSGTRAYMAPEQLAFGTADVRTDQFSFCVALHEALTGERPYDEAALRGAALDLAGPGGRISPRIPRWLAPILARGVHPDPARRWPSMEVLVQALVHTPVRRRRILLGIGMVLVVAAGWWWLSVADRPSCDASSRLAEVWSDARADALREQMKAGPAFARGAIEPAVRGLDAWAGEWNAAYTEACEATWVEGIETAAQLERTSACLDRARIGLGRAVDLLARAEPETIARAGDVVAALGEPGSCRGSAEPAPQSDRERELVMQADEVALLVAAGELDAALQASERSALTDADRHSAAARAWLARGTALARAARPKEGEAALLGSLRLAIAHDAARVGLRAACELVGLYAYELSDPERGAVAAGILDGWADRVELTASDRAEIAHARAAAAELRGDAATAELLYREAIGSRAQAGITVARTSPELRLGALLQGLGRVDEARTLYAESRARIERELGGEHPEIAAVEHALGSLALLERRVDDAERHFERALAIQTAALGPRSVRRASALAGLAELHRIRGEARRAVELGSASWALQSTLPLGDSSRGSALQVLALAHLDLGEYATSLGEHEALLRESPTKVAIVREGVQLNIGWLLCELERCVEARPAFEAVARAQPPESAWHRYADSGLAAVELAEDRTRAALERARRVLHEIEAAGSGKDEAELVAELNSTVALALERSGGDEGEIVAAAEVALAGFEAVGRESTKVARIREVLARHRG
jgi:tetratricopeptide (TPR) repeat protein/predicted Ser/Thr protein kinase